MISDNAIIPMFLGSCAEDVQLSLNSYGSIPEVYTEERLFVAEYVNKDDIAGFSLARCRVESGTTTQLHSLSVNEWYAVETGEGLMELDSEEKQVFAGSIVQIPAGARQRITNTGNQDLIFFCICMPRFTPESYRSHE